jgi:hypothetical protein
MTDSIQHPEDALAGASREEIMSMLFANMVIQQTNMAMMLLGKVAHPESGEFIQDVEAAKMFIDQLAMLEAKTKGNLSKQEEQLMKQALAELRMAFVEAVNSPAGHGTPAPAPSAPEVEPTAPAATPPPAPEARATPAPPGQPAPDESRKKFSKKY